MRVSGPAGGFDIGISCNGITDPKVVGHRTVEKICVLVDDRNLPANRLERKVSDIVTANPNSSFVRIVEAQQKAHDGGFSDTARPDEADTLAGLHRKIELLMRRPFTTGVCEAHAFEHNRRLHIRGCRRIRFLRHDGPRIEQMENCLRGSLCHHTVMHQGPHIAKRAKHFDAKHQDHYQRSELHAPLCHAEGANRQGCRRTNGNACIRNTAPQRVGRQNPHCRAKEIVRFLFHGLCAGTALTEGLQGGEPLDGIQELRRERFIGARPAEAVVLIPAVKNLWCDQGDEGGGQHDERHRQIEEHYGREDQHRRQRRDDELRQVLTEIDFQLFDTFYHGQDGVARALKTEMRGTKLRHLIVDHCPQMHLHFGRGIVRDHGAEVFKQPAHDHHGSDTSERPHHLFQGCALEDARDQPSQQNQTRDAKQHRQNTDSHRPEDAQSHSLRVAPKPRVKIHACPVPLCPNICLAQARMTDIKHPIYPSTHPKNNCCAPHECA